MSLTNLEKSIGFKLPFEMKEEDALRILQQLSMVSLC